MHLVSAVSTGPQQGQPAAPGLTEGWGSRRQAGSKSWAPLRLPIALGREDPERRCGAREVHEGTISSDVAGVGWPKGRGLSPGPAPARSQPCPAHLASSPAQPQTPAQHLGQSQEQLGWVRARSQARGPWLLEGGQGFLAERLIPAERESGQQGDRVGRFWAKTGTIWILTKTGAALPCSGLPSLRIVSTTVLPAPGSQLCTHRASSAAHSPRSSPPAGSSAPAWTLGRGGGRQGPTGQRAGCSHIFPLTPGKQPRSARRGKLLPSDCLFSFVPSSGSPSHSLSSRHTLLWDEDLFGPHGPRQGQALTSTYPCSTPTAGRCLCKQSALQDRRPRARSKLSPKKAGLHWPRWFVWPEAADRSQPGHCPHSGHSCAQTPAAASVTQWRRPGAEHIIDHYSYVC